jgi:hypothetical protein
LLQIISRDKGLENETYLFEPSLFGSFPCLVVVSPYTRWTPNCWCKFGTEGGAPTPQYSSPPKGQRTKEPLRRTTPSSTTANSTTTATTRQKLEKTTTTYYFGVLHHLMSCLVNYNDPPIYRDGGRWRFSPRPLVVIFFRAPGGRSIYKKPLEPTQRPTTSYMCWATPPADPTQTFLRSIACQTHISWSIFTQHILSVLYIPR